MVDERDSKRERIYVREVGARTYSLHVERSRRLAVSRVRRDDPSDESSQQQGSPDPSSSRAWWVVNPGDSDFWTQSIEMHFRELPPGVGNTTHGHQNEACFYWLQGSGIDVHDGESFPWSAGDLCFVPADTVHQHINTSKTDRAVALVVKAKSLWMLLGLFFQGGQGPFEKDGFGPRRSWSGLAARDGQTVVSPSEYLREVVKGGSVLRLTSGRFPEHRNHSVDLDIEEVNSGETLRRHWHMADEVGYVLSGSGTSRQWSVECEIADQYYAHIAEEPTEWQVSAGDTLYVPPNTVHELSAGTSGLRVVTAQNRMFKALGYTESVILE